MIFFHKAIQGCPQSSLDDECNEPPTDHLLTEGTVKEETGYYDN